MICAYCVVFLLAFSALQILAQDEDYIVQLPYGKIRGHILQSLKGNQYYAFQDIPYAAPPTGDLRYKEAKNPEPWDGILNTTSNKVQCPQEPSEVPIDFLLRQNEDCLYINVYSPQEPGSTDLLPVIVWIHGGAFAIGSSSRLTYNPGRFADHNVVVVTFNYRLGSLGFLSTGDGTIPGNLGLKDQVFALKWVQSNIELFGGDPNQVTVAGQSAGAMSIGYLLVTSSTTGLFRAAIQQSGTSLCQMSITLDPRSNAFNLGKIIDSNFTSNNSVDLLNLLRNTSSEDLMNAAGQLVPVEANSAGYLYRFRWTPVLENENEANPLITVPMQESFMNGQFQQVPVLLGFNSEEALAFLNDNLDYLASDYDNDSSLLVDKALNIPSESKSTVGAELKKIYTDMSFSEDKAAFVKYSSDAGFTRAMMRQAQLSAKYVPVYFYEFSYEGLLGMIVSKNRYKVPGAEGASHVEELIYEWDVLPPFTESDQLATERISLLWSNFVKYLNPTPEPDETLNNVSWPTIQYDSSDFQYLNINNTLEVQINPRTYQKVRPLLDQYQQPPYLVF